MAFKSFKLEDLGEVKVYKRRGTRNIRLSIGNDGQIKVVMPLWASYSMGLDFVLKQKQWINEHHKPQSLLLSGVQIGKSFILSLEAVDKPNIRTKLSQNAVTVFYPEELGSNHQLVQKAAKRACLKALTRDTEEILVPRLRDLAAEYDFIHQSVKVKNLKARWGSCSSKGDITLSLYLPQLPWPLIDYVLTHELVHTKVFGHGPQFWEAMNQLLPNVKSLRREIKHHKPLIIDTSLTV